MVAFVAVCLVLVSPILLMLALGVRLAGDGRPLNLVDYSRVADPRGLHRAVGNRLLLLPLLTGAGGAVVFVSPSAFAWVVPAVCLGSAVVVFRCVVAASHFTASTSASS